jgi:hypothetical protein
VTVGVRVAAGRPGLLFSTADALNTLPAAHPGELEPLVSMANPAAPTENPNPESE